MKAQAVAQAMARGLEAVWRDVDIITYPMASGGAGTTELAVRAAHGRIRHETIAVNNRHTRDVRWALLPDGTALFDATDALGKPDGPSQFATTYTSSRALGQMILRLCAKNPQRIAIALGDALTMDAGMGLLQQFGVRFYDDAGSELDAHPRALMRARRVDFTALQPPAIPILALASNLVTWNQRVQEEDFRLDLVYGGLKEASSETIEELGAHIRVPLAEVPGSGVGGGMGIGLLFLGAQFNFGAQFLADIGGARDLVWTADWIMTGSSVLSGESQNQAVGIMARLARDAGLPAVALGTELRRGHMSLFDEGLIGIYSVLDRPRNFKEVQRMLAALIEQAAYRTGVWMQALGDP